MYQIGLINKLYYEWWKNIDKSIFFLIIILFSLGLFFSLVSTSLIASDKLNTNNYYFFLRHLFYTFIGIFFIIFFSLFLLILVLKVWSFISSINL